MASLLYKNHRIVISTVPHKFTNRWSWSVVVSWFEDDRQKLRPIKNWFVQFDSKKEAEMCAIEAGKTWVDKRLENHIEPHLDSLLGFVHPTKIVGSVFKAAMAFSKLPKQ